MSGIRPPLPEKMARGWKLGRPEHGRPYEFSSDCSKHHERLTGGVEQATNRLTFGELIIQSDGGSGLFDVNRNAAISKHSESLRAGPQHQLHSPAQDYNLAAAVE